MDCSGGSFCSGDPVSNPSLLSGLAFLFLVINRRFQIAIVLQLSAGRGRILISLTKSFWLGDKREESRFSDSG